MDRDEYLQSLVGKLRLFQIDHPDDCVRQAADELENLIGEPSPESYVALGRKMEQSRESKRKAR